MWVVALFCWVLAVRGKRGEWESQCVLLWSLHMAHDESINYMVYYLIYLYKSSHNTYHAMLHILSHSHIYMSYIILFIEVVVISFIFCHVHCQLSMYIHPSYNYSISYSFLFIYFKFNLTCIYHITGKQAWKLFIEIQVTLY